MPSSKKKNKQRKSKAGGNAGSLGSTNAAAKGKTKADSKHLQIVSNKEVMRESFDKTLKSLPPKDAVKRVGKGMGLSTHLVEFLGGQHASTVHRRYLQKMVDAGLISTLLELVSQCEDVGILDVIEASACPFDSKSRIVLRHGGEFMEGHVSSPFIWIDILRNIVSNKTLPGKKRLDNCRIEIATGIGPLIKCLCNDMKREFFKSKMHWYDAFMPFTNLIFGLVGNRSEDDHGYTPDTIPILIQYPGLLDTLTRSIFWAKERPDIMKEADVYVKVFKQSKESDFAVLADYAGAFIEQVLRSSVLEDDIKFYYDGEGKERNMNIGTTLIVSEGYDPDCSVPFISGLLSLLQGSESAIMTNEQFLPRPSIIDMIKIMAICGCVDKDVFARLIDVGRKSVTDYDEAVIIMQAIFESMHDFTSAGEDIIPQDSRFAPAIGAGLFEMILQLLARFKGRSDKSDLIRHMGMTLQVVQSVSLHLYSKKAIALRYDSIVEALKNYDANDTYTTTATLECKDLVEMIRSMADLNGGDQGEAKGANILCYNCLKQLTQPQRRFCSKCNIACYCSKECQVEHWKNGGHKVECKKRSKREVQKLEAQQNNLSGVAKKIMYENRSKLVIDAVLKGVDILDCVVRVDLIETPPLIQLVETSDLLHSPERKLLPEGHLIMYFIQREAEDARTKPSLDGKYRNVAEKTDGLISQGFMASVIPWKTAQDNLKERFCGQLEQLRENPELGEAYLAQLRYTLVRQFVAKSIEDANEEDLQDPDARSAAIDAVTEDVLEKEKTLW